jgi:uncharacterized protein (DUF58 family)
MQPQTTIASKSQPATFATNQAPVTKTRIRVRPTHFGKTFLFILAAMLVASLNSNNNLGFLFTFLLGSMTAVSVFHTRRNLAGLQIAQIRAKSVFAGEPAHFDVLLKKSVPDGRAVEAAFPGETPVTIDFTGDFPVAIQVSRRSLKRGLLTPGPLEVSTEYPFGLFQARTTLSHAAVCLVYPRPIAGPLTTRPGGTTGGAEGGGTGPGVDDFVGLKAYQPGDSLGQISWKSFSRGQGLQVKQFIGETSRSLLVDWYLLSEPHLEKKLSRLCSMVLQAHQSGLHFGLRLPAGTVAPARGEQHLKTCLTKLALFGLPGEAP